MFMRSFISSILCFSLAFADNLILNNISFSLNFVLNVFKSGTVLLIFGIVLYFSERKKTENQLLTWNIYLYIITDIFKYEYCMEVKNLRAKACILWGWGWQNLWKALILPQTRFCSSCHFTPLSQLYFPIRCNSGLCNMSTKQPVYSKYLIMPSIFNVKYSLIFCCCFWN